MIGFRMQMIAAGYEDGNDANRLRTDPIFKMAQDALPSGRDLASQSTLCRLENLPGVRSLPAMGRAMVGLYCASFRQVPKRIVLDIDDTLMPCTATSSCVSSTPITTNMAFNRSSCSTARGGSSVRSFGRPGGRVGPTLRRLVRAIRSNWPNARILFRADSHYCSPLVIDWCRANDVDFIFGLASTPTLRKKPARWRALRRRPRQARSDASRSSF